MSFSITRRHVYLVMTLSLAAGATLRDHFAASFTLHPARLRTTPPLPDAASAFPSSVSGDELPAEFEWTRARRGDASIRARSARDVSLLRSGRARRSRSHG